MKDKIKGILRGKKLVGLLFVTGIIAFILIKNSFFDKQETEAKYATFTLSELTPLKLEGEVIFSEAKEIFFDASLGKITGINVENGQEVQKDDVLLTYLNEDSQATQITQENAVNSNNLQIQQAQENVNVVTQKYNDAFNKLDKEKKQLNSAQDEEERAIINSNIQQLTESVNNAYSELLQAQHAVQTATNDSTASATLLEKTKEKTNPTVMAPMNGTVSVDATAINNSEKPVITITTQNKIIEGKVTEYDLENIHIEDEVTVMTVGSGKSAQGKITSISQTPINKKEESESVNYKFTVEGEFPWVEGLTTIITVPQKELIIPTSAIQKEKEKEYVYVYHEGVAKKTMVETYDDAGRKIVKTGVTLKDKLIVNPDEELTNNQKVKVQIND